MNRLQKRCVIEVIKIDDNTVRDSVVFIGTEKATVKAAERWFRKWCCEISGGRDMVSKTELQEALDAGYYDCEGEYVYITWPTRRFVKGKR